MAMRSTHSVARKNAHPTGFRNKAARRGAIRHRRVSVRRARAFIPGPVRISADFMTAFAKSPSVAERLTTDLLKSIRPSKNPLAEAGELLHFVSASGNMLLRRTLIAGFSKAGADLALVHHIAMLPREQTAAFIKDYLDGGGSLAPVVQWLGIAGGLHRQGRASAPTRLASRWAAPARRRGRKMPSRFSLPSVGGLVGGIIDDLKGAAKKGLDAAGNLVDGVIKAGGSVVDAIGAAAAFTVEQATDLVEGLVQAGKTAAEILTGAAAKGIAQLNKYVEAVLGAGRAIAEVVTWAASQVAATAQAAIGKLLSLGRSLLDVVNSVVTLGRAVLVPTVKSLFGLGKKVSDLMGAMAKEAVAAVKSVVDAMLAVGQSLRTIVIDAAKGLSIIACGNVIRALLELGKSVAELMREAAAAAGDTLRLIVRSLLLGVGHTVAQILTSAADVVANAVNGVVQALLALGKSLPDIVGAAVGQTLSIVTKVFGALIAIGRKSQEILVSLGGRAVSVLRTAFHGLMLVGVSLATIMNDIFTGVAQAFRRSFLEGLLALGKTPFQIVKAAVETAVSIGLLAFALLLEILGGYRPLTSEELAEATKVFGNTIDLSRVRLGFADLPGDLLRLVNVELPRAFTTMYLINFGPGAVVEMQTIIHELAHVWQGVQQGPIYMTRALEAQITAGLDALFHKGKYDDEAAYRVTEAALDSNGGDLKKFNPEQQASIVEFYWVLKFSKHAVPTGLPHSKKTNPAALPALAKLVPYVQKVNSALRSPVRTAVKKKGSPVRRARRSSTGRVPAYA